MNAPSRETGLLAKRVRRVLRAVGLARPHKAPPVPGKRGLPSLAQARVIVTEIYQIILKCEPDAQGRDTYAGGLASGSLSQLDVVRAVIESADFGTACTRHQTVATALSGAILNALIRSTDDAAIRAYAAGLVGGMPVADFVREICASPEFRSAGVAIPAPSGDIDQMVEGLIAARLIDEGAILGLPPLAASGQPAMSPQQLTSLVRTLDMLADKPAARL